MPGLKWSPSTLSLGERFWKSCNQRFQWRAIYFTRPCGSRESESHRQTGRTTTTTTTATTSLTTKQIKGNAPGKTYIVELVLIGNLPLLPPASEVGGR